MNICLICISKFFWQFCLLVWYKPGKEHILPNAFSCLASANTNLPSQDPAYSQLDALFIYNTTLIAMNKDLAQRIVKDYENNPWWIKISSQLSLNDVLGDNKAALPFVQQLPPMDADPYFLPRPTVAVDNHNNEYTAPPTLSRKLIYHVDHIFDMHRLYVSTSVVLEVIAIMYGKSHPGFAWYYKIMSCS